MRTILLASISLASLTVSGAALAQDAVTATPPQEAQSATLADTAQDADNGLGDIIVTAQRREENLQNAAVAVDVVQGAELTAAGNTDVGSLSDLTPALTVQPSSTGNLIFLRGVGNFTLVPTSDPAIAFNYDGVYIGRPTSTSGAFYDLERIEVLKGPQGTLYGRNATGGAINVIPQKPRLGEWGGYATVSYGSFDEIIAEGAINAPMGANGAMRLSGSRIDRDGYFADGTSDDKSYALRFQMMSELTPDLTVRVAADYSDQGGVGIGATYLGRYQYAGPVAGYQFVPSNLPLSEGFYTPAAQAFRQTGTAGPAGRRLDALAPYPYRDNHFFGMNADISYAMGFGTLTVIPSYRHAKLNLLADAAAFIARARETDEQYALEVRLTGNRLGIFDYTLGAFYYDESVVARQGIFISALAAIFTDELTTKSFAPFGRVTANLTESLRLVGGIRYTRDSKTFRERGASGTIVCQVGTPPSCPTAPLFPFVEDFALLPFPFPTATQVPPVVPIGGGAIVARSNRSQDNRLVNTRTTWRGAIEFDVGARSLLYASVETGFRSGGFSGARGFETYDPEYITAYTVGAKNRFLNNRLQLNVEAFYWDYKDQQVNFVGLDAAGATANQTRNIGQSRIKGIEAETRFLLTPTTLLSANVQYLDARNTRFIYQTASTPLPPLTGCAVTAASATLANVDCSGFPAYNSPDWTVNLAAQQTLRLGAVNLIFAADTQYKTERYVAFGYLPTELEPSVWRTNAQVTLASAGDRWSLAGYVQNIEDNRTPNFMTLAPVTNFLVASTTAPRTFGVRGSVRF